MIICDKIGVQIFLSYDESFDYVQGRYGDNIISFSPEHIKKVDYMMKDFVEYNITSPIISLGQYKIIEKELM